MDGGNRPTYRRIGGDSAVESHATRRLRTFGYSQDATARTEPIVIVDGAFRASSYGSGVNSRIETALVPVSRNRSRSSANVADAISSPNAVSQALPPLLNPMDFRPKPRLPSSSSCVDQPFAEIWATPPPNRSRPSPPNSPPRPIAAAQPPWNANRHPSAIRFLYTFPDQSMRAEPEVVSPRITPPFPLPISQTTS